LGAHPLVLELDDRGDQREALDPLDERVLDDLAEVPGEGEKPLGRQLLGAEEDHQMIEPGAPDRRDRVVVEILGKIDPGDVGPERAGDRTDIKRVAAHRLDPPRLSYPAEPLDRKQERYIIISGYDMEDQPLEYGLAFLLAFDRRIHHLQDGYWIKFEIERIEATPRAPHGLSYSFTLHAPDGTRLVGFDNTHSVPARGSRFKRRSEASDHWHRTENDPGRPYQFRDAQTLIDDFLTRRSGCWASAGSILRFSKWKRWGGRS
jgi:Family of unknown function (DUF6516)